MEGTQGKRARTEDCPSRPPSPPPSHSHILSRPERDFMQLTTEIPMKDEPFCCSWRWLCRCWIKRTGLCCWAECSLVSTNIPGKREGEPRARAASQGKMHGLRKEQWKASHRDQDRACPTPTVLPGAEW